MARSLGDRLARQAAIETVGRDDELALLEHLFQPDGPIVCFVHGIGGIGKSSLIRMFATRAQGGDVVCLDCRTIEPTEGGFLSELAATIGAPAPTLAAIVAQLAISPQPVILALDTYESFRLLDAWLRQVLIPALPANVRVLLAGREPPLSAWFTTPGWQGLFRVLTLGPLRGPDALALVQQAGLSPEHAERLTRFARGHPLALRLAIANRTPHPQLDQHAIPLQHVVEHLSRLYLTDVSDPVLRRVLQAASVTRRVTRGVLRVLLPGLDPDELYDRLRGLAFVEAGRDGLVIHDVVRQTLASDLKAADPAAYRAYRRAAWSSLRAEVQQVERAELWRYTADMLYLLETPEIREVFFPTDSPWYTIAPARPDEQTALAAMIERHEGAAASRVLTAWWEQLPQAFHVVHDSAGAAVGFYCLFTATAARSAAMEADPITRAWAAHLRQHAVGAQERVLFLRSWLSRDHGAQPSAVQAAVFLDIKRVYMELRPQLRRLYTPTRDLGSYGGFVQQVGFRVVPEAYARVGDTLYHTLMLDFGPASVDGWLADLVGAQIAAPEPEAVALDREAQELIVDGRRMGLTQLECAVLQYLMERAGKAVARGDLLEDVWGYRYDGSSNVVDVIIGALRKKLGERAPLIETVTKVGYRFRRA